MDGPHSYSSSFSFPSNNEHGKVHDGNPYFPALDFSATGPSNSYVSNGIKRKHTALSQPFNLKDGSSLALGLGLSSSSCTTLCSGKETEEESSIDLGLSISLSAVNNRPKLPKKPNLELQLSLSSEIPESEVTNTTTNGFVPCDNFPEFAPPVDGRSISSHWENGPQLSAFNKNIDISIPSQDDSCSFPHPVTPNISSSAKTTPVPSLPNQHRRPGTKPCQFEGCTRGARGATGLCIAHGGGRRCQRDGCDKGAEGRTVFCKAHGGGRRCQFLGCTKSAEGRTDFCIGHGGGKRCSHESCTRAARGKSGLCIRHGGGKRCQVANCTKSAEGISGLCISHGGGKRCQYPECTKGAQGSTMFCKAHGGGKRCQHPECTKGAEGSTPFCKGHGGGKRCTSDGCSKSVHGGTQFCVSHGGGKRCAIPECTKSARGRTDHCVRHGGGKRCKFIDGCTKSAQGSTDFCKAHGGGKRCSWGINVPGVIQCDKFARGKSGRCTAHGGQISNSGTQDTKSSMSTHMKGTTSISSISFMTSDTTMDRLSLPEGRVHGGGLMAMLKGGVATTDNDDNGESSEGSKLVPHSWV